MFNYSDMIKRAVQYFPKWSDIRKRYNNSLGGNLLSSVIEEELEVEDEIQDYIKSYFLHTYLGHEDEVMTYVYMAHIGEIDDLNEINVYYDNTYFPFVETAKEFENINNYSYYEEGKVYIKTEDYIEGVNEIRIQFDDLSSTYPLTKTNVWNIFDEYATFVNTRRYENETNSELVKRILYVTQNLPNSTEDGLKHAIVSELLTDCPELTIDEIKLERPTPENLIKPYEDYETLLDLLADINRDIYRSKKWDLDYWTYDFESISYIPHVWDKAITDWKNGVGSMNDLEVYLADESNTTDATIHFYEKSLLAFQKYVYDKHIDHTIKFNMIKYNNVLNKTNVKYKISASELHDITYEDISLTVSEAEETSTTYAVRDITMDWGENIVNIENNIFDSSNKDEFSICFKNKDAQDITINTAEVIYVNDDNIEDVQIVDLLEERDGFKFNDNNTLCSSHNKLTLKRIENYTSIEGLENSADGIIVSSNKPGIAKYNLTGRTDLYNLYIYYDLDCEFESIPNNIIYGPSTYWDYNDNLVVRGDYSSEIKTVKFNIEANTVSFKINETNEKCRLSIVIEDTTLNTTYSKELEPGTIFSMDETLEPHHYNITIEVLSNENILLSDFKYKNYSFKIETANGDYLDENNNYIIPANLFNNELIITMSTKQTKSPVLKRVILTEKMNIEYITHSIKAKEGYYRIININSNADTYLRRNNIEELYDFTESYKATADNAIIKVDLSEYDSIIEIETDLGPTKIKEDEYDSKYYYIYLKQNQEIRYITVKGIKSFSEYSYTLEELIKNQMPDYDSTYDKIYCSKITEGLIVTRQDGSNEILLLDSNSIINTNTYKYKLNLPSYLGGIFGSTSGTKNITLTHYNDFDYISIYPAGSQLYEAINEYNTYIKDNRNIPIVNNFAPLLDTNKLLYYTVQLFDTSQGKDITVKFHNDTNVNDAINVLPSWSIGTSNTYVAIENNDKSLLAVSSYSTNTYSIESNEKLSSSIDIKDTYVLSNSTILNTEKFIIEPLDERVTVVYKEYNGLEETANLLKYEEITFNSDGFNKLTYSNIDTIYHLSTTPFANEYEINENIDYTLLKTQGVIIWNTMNITSKLYLVYSIKKPIAFQFDISYLYDAIDYDTNAYNELDSITMKNLENGYSFNIKNKLENMHKNYDINFTYDDVDLIYVSCSEPTFEAKQQNEIISFNKYIEEDTILIKTGYYYLNGKEYYLYGNNEGESLNNNKYYDFESVDISGGELTTHIRTDNFIYNSEMRLKEVDELYNLKCNLKMPQGVSTFNKFTACETINNWYNLGMNVTLTEGLNDLALKFVPEIDNAYAYIDITSALTNDINYISFYASDNLKVYIGYEKKYLDIKFNSSLNIQIDKEILTKNSSNNIRTAMIEKSLDTKYYLVIQNEGVIDDIIISKDEFIANNHIKNIDLLGLDLYENRAQGVKYRMNLETEKDYNGYHAGLMSDKYIKTTSDINWYVTKIKEFSSDNDFRELALNNIGVNLDYIYTTTNIGTLETPAIYIGDPKTIKNLIIKINNIEFTNMTGFQTTISTSDGLSEPFNAFASLSKNIGHTNNNLLKQYIKLRIEMPQDKIIESISIYAEYKSTNESPLYLRLKDSGYIESRIFDLEESINCKVSSINIEDISDLDDILIYIRASKDTDRLDIWTDWKEIKLNNDYNITNLIEFENVQFLQYKVVLKSRQAYIKFNNLEIEVI